ncbi:LuxR C-terminal-related transcriptional regulator [Patulibacter sp. NPDC049589]|uniref:LuxR C-terminal-related transcriptional regulator n=1 Tax=Patulibacter sp. NPDC049589 TaxID=3154731 RepID=UPI00343F17C0
MATTTITTPTEHPMARGSDDRLFAIALQRAAADLLSAEPPDPDPERALRLIDAMSATLDRIGTTLLAVPTAPEASAELAELLMSTGAQQARLRAHVGDLRFRALGRTYEAMARIRRATSAAEVARVVPGELCAACGFDRALISRVQGSSWFPTALHVVLGADDGPSDAQRAELLAMEIPLRPPLVEAELVRRGIPVVVEDPARDERVHQPLVAATGTRAYAVAPITAGGRVVGLLHADNHWTRRRLTPADLDNLRSFAEGVGLAVERTVLSERLAMQRRRVSEAFESTATTIADIGDADLLLARRLERREPEGAGGGMARLATLDADVARDAQIHGMLTPRERDVLERMARGSTNSQIADELVVGVSTVKSHVKHILRKLKASNRAEAVSRYLRLADGDQDRT